MLSSQLLPTCLCHCSSTDVFMYCTSNNFQSMLLVRPSVRPPVLCTYVCSYCRSLFFISLFGALPPPSPLPLAHVVPKLPVVGCCCTYSTVLACMGALSCLLNPLHCAHARTCWTSSYSSSSSSKRKRRRRRRRSMDPSIQLELELEQVAFSELSFGRLGLASSF